jgi:hypothetical protein
MVTLGMRQHVPPEQWKTSTTMHGVGCHHIYMQRQPLVDLFDNIYYNRTVYTDVLEQLDGVGSRCFGILTRRTARYKLTA